MLIDKSLILNVAGSGDTIIQAATSSADATSRVFHITGGTVAISSVAVRDGNSSIGGGIFNLSATLALTNSTVTGNWAAESGGGICNGGAVILTLTNSSVNSNIASLNGGGIYDFSTLIVSSSTIS